MSSRKAKLFFDHIAVVATTLEQGVAYVQSALGVEVPIGGKHPRMGTYNHLLRLGDNSFLEVISIDPEAKRPERPRWFNLDNMGNTAPKIGTWIVNSKNIDSSLNYAPAECGIAEEITRGDLKWKISIPADGSLPLDGAFPTIMQWPVGLHPATKMKDSGCELVHLTIEHPEACLINTRLANKLIDTRVAIISAEKFKITVQIETPNGVQTL